MTNKGWLSLRCLAPSAALGAAGLGTVWTLLRRSLPKTSGRLRLRGLHGPGEALRHRWGGPPLAPRDVNRPSVAGFSAFPGAGRPLPPVILFIRCQHFFQIVAETVLIVRLISFDQGLN